MSTFTCVRCPGQTFTGDIKDLQAHDRGHDTPAPIDLNGPGQAWDARAITAVQQLAATGKDFTFYDVARIAGEPLNPRSDWGVFSQKVEHMRLAKPVGYQQSERPGTKGSAVRVWRGIPASERKVA